jgi:hypothetical protein
MEKARQWALEAVKTACEELVSIGKDALTYQSIDA